MNRLIAGALFLLGTVTAHAVAPNFTATSPAGGQRGTEIEITLRGERLADAQEIIFYGDGLTAEPITGATATQAKAKIKIAPDCRLGEHALRVRTASGISALRIFYVGPFATLEEKEPNNELAKAQPVPLNSTIEGSIGAEDIDWFAVEVKQGQRLSVEVEGARLGRTLFDPILFVHTADGRPLARSDDTPLLGHDGFVSLLAPADGKLFVQLRDVAYSGNGHFYRLHIGSFPRPALATPLGGRAGETLEARFLGDPAGEFSQTVALPATATTGKFGVLAERDGPAASANWLRASAFPNAAAVPAGNSAATAPLLDRAPPLAFNGVLATKGEPAFFKFTAKKDQNLDFQVYARRLGSPLDSVITVLGPKGASLGNNDDAAGNPDSAVRARIPDDGDYTVKIADQLGRGGPTFAYRVEITEVPPTVALSIPDTARYDYETRKSIVVPRGNRFAALMTVTRDTFNDEVRLAFDGLPEGVTMAADKVPGNVSSVPVVFEAAADAPVTGRLLTPVARATDEAKWKNLTSGFRHRVEWVRIQNATVYVESEVNQIAAAVVEEVPFKVSVVQPKVPLMQGGEMALKIVAERKEGFDEPITVKMVWNPPGVSTLPDMTIPKGATSVDYKINATTKADERAWKIAFIASATVQGGTAYVSTQLADLEVAAGFLAGKIDHTKLERGKTGKLTCLLEQRKKVPGTAVARLTGLPDGATAPDVEITAESKEAVFEITTTDKCPTGPAKNIACVVTITQAGEPIVNVLAPGSVLRIDAPRAAAGAGAVTAKTND
ncbi:MAG: hypothetical protein RLZZ15_3249 [Verrucomicrobiota bacterium]|jgi:hypothetical protein